MSDHVLVPFTDSEEAAKALEHALDSFPGAEISVVHVGNANAASDGGGKHLERAAEISDEHEAAVDMELLQGAPKEEIIRFAETNDVDHIVMGSRGRSGMSRLLLGSVAETVVRHSSVPVTVVR